MISWCCYNCILLITLITLYILMVNSLRSRVPAICANVTGFTKRQIRLCEQQPVAAFAASEGARKGIIECQKQFKNERWNCTPEGSEQIFGQTLLRGSRETAFFYAITSSGVVHTLAQSCSAGNLTDCSCDRTKRGRSINEGWKWGGCSDNIEYAISFSKKFLDSPEKLAFKKNRENLEALMNLHNNQAGRLAIANKMQLKCRCHGISGSCELKTCWRTLPPFSEIGKYLKQKYENSVQITKKIKRRIQRRGGKVKRRVPFHKEDLVHINKSPNYCYEDHKKGILGTSGRQCNKTSNGPESCELLCCGRGYNTQVIPKIQGCRCKFHWCCEVTCDVCSTTEEIYTCK